MNDFEHVKPLDLGEGARVQGSPAGCAMNLFDDSYGVMIPLGREQAIALRDWLNEHFPSSSGQEAVE